MTTTTTTNFAMTLDELIAMRDEYAAKNRNCPVNNYFSDVVEDLDALIADGGVVVKDALFTLDGEHVANAKMVQVRSNYVANGVDDRWVINYDDGRPATWLTANAKRRATIAKKGYVEGYITYSVRVETRDGGPRYGVSAKIILVEAISICADKWEE